jgi:hypothetical protein
LPASKESPTAAITARLAEPRLVEPPHYLIRTRIS